MKTWKKYLPALIVVLVLGSLVFGFGSFLQTYIVEPISLLFWALWRLIASIDQAILWAIMILVGVVLVIILVSGGEKGSLRSAYHLPTVSSNRLEHWQKLIEEATLGSSENETLRRSLRELLAQTEAVSGGSQSTRMTKFNQAFSAPAQRFLFPQAYGGKPKRKPGGVIRALKPLRKLLGRYFYTQEEIIDEILQVLEIELELESGKQQ